MASPPSNQQLQGAFPAHNNVPQSSNNPSPNQPQDPRYSHYSADDFGHHGQSTLQPSSSYIHAHMANEPFISELAAPPPPAPPTSTSPDQLTEDERLAHKIQQMELAEAQARTRSSTIQSQAGTQLPMSATSTLLGEWQTQTPVSRQHTLVGEKQSSASMVGQSNSKFGDHHFAQASQLQRSPTASPAELAPEVVLDPRQPPASPGDVAPEVVPGPQLQPTLPAVARPSPSPKAHPTAHLPPAPLDPASLSAYLETHRQVPLPTQWILPPAIHTYFNQFHYPSKSDWLDTPDNAAWHTRRFSENIRRRETPEFQFTFSQRKGGSLRAPRYQWSLTNPTAKEKSERNRELFKYDLRFDHNTGKRKTETLIAHKGRDLYPTYVNAINYDSLNFLGPDGRKYKWVSHAPVSSLNFSRYDILRHALFVSTSSNGNQDPLYGQIVADHTYWDGYTSPDHVHAGTTCRGCGVSPIKGPRWLCKACEDHDVCEECRLSNHSVTPACKLTLVSLPDEALCIRSSKIDVAMVIGTLQILKDWEKHTLLRQKARDTVGFDRSVAEARKCDLGRMRHWTGSDFEGSPTKEQMHGTVLVVLEGLKAPLTGKN